MNAIAKNLNEVHDRRSKTSCAAVPTYAIGDLPRSDAQESGIAPCGRHSGTAPEISKLNGWGGARTNSGGVRLGAGRKPKAAVTEAEGWEGARWCVFQTHPSAETTSAHEITRSGYRSYMPLIAIRRQDPVVRSMFHKIRVPMFANYGFVELTFSQPWVPIRYMIGVRDLLLSSSGRPSPVPVGFVERLMEEDEVRCDLSPETLPPLKVGARVRINEGAMQSFSGMVLGCDGLCTMVNVEMFGRLVAVRFDRAAVSEDA